MNPQQLRHDLVRAGGAEMRRRRAIILLSLTGVAAMTPVCLIQTGIVGHLPDPPVGDFHSDETNLSEVAYQFGTPDGTLALASLAANIPLAAWGGRNRARREPWAPLAAAGKALADVCVSASYFWQMLSGKEAWCPYCLVGSLANCGILAMAIPEALAAAKHLSKARSRSAEAPHPELQPQPA